MTIGTIATSILTDIANAIRYQAGVATLYKPGQMAAAVAALDGTNAGNYQAQPYMQLQSGVLSDSVFEDIADAIRAQNGSAATYEPGDMAAAILALSWAPSYRALLLDDGTMEFTYLTSTASPSGGTVVTSFDVSTSGYSSAASRPWDSVKLQVTRAVFHSSVANAGVTSVAYYFNGFANLVEVSGVENLAGVTSTVQLFTSCSSLESVFATSFDNSAIASSTNMFYGCSKLVGGTDGFVPTNTSGSSVFKLGSGGVITNPNADPREWMKVYVYDDGLVELTSAGAADGMRNLLASGRLCAGAKYNAAGVIPGYAYRTQFRTVQFRSDMNVFGELNLDYVFYGLAEVTSVVGLGNLANVSELKYAFAAMTGITSLDFSGFDPSTLTSLHFTFSGCSNLATIYADATWALPSSGCSGSNTFYNCNSLVGGNGTTYSSTRMAYQYMRIDAAGQVGYLTAVS